MKPIFAALGRLAAISFIAFGIATVANYFNHRGYWYGTIFRVQTTDFNILSHSLPTKLSQALIQRNEAEIQRTLDSNYGLFGIVITNCTSVTSNCPNQRILYKTRSQMRWSRELTLEGLRSAPFDYLRNPPPASAERGYENSRDTTWEPTGNANLGEIIGRVYYVRGIPPEFWADYSGWLGKQPASLLSDSGSHKYYTLTISLFLSSGLAAWGFVEWILLQKRLTQQEKQRLLRQLDQQNHLIAELRGYRDEQELSIHSLAQETTRYRNEFRQKELEQRRSAQNLKELSHRLQQLNKQKIEGQEQAIAKLEAQIAERQRIKQEVDKSLEDLGYHLQETQKELVEKTNSVQRLNHLIVSITQDRDQAIQQAKQLKERVKLLEILTTESKKFGDYTAQENQQLAQENQQLKDQLGQLQYENANLIAENLQLKAQVKKLEEQFQSTRIQRISLSNLKLALVGGHPKARRQIIQQLEGENGLQSANVVQIPPGSEQSINQTQLRAKIANYMLIVVQMDYCDHSLSNMVSNLQRRGALSGEVIHCSGRNDAISKIMQWAIDNPRLLRGSAGI